jgi:hypothetical protein
MGIVRPDVAGSLTGDFFGSLRRLFGEFGSILGTFFGRVGGIWPIFFIVVGVAMLFTRRKSSV